MTRRRVLLYSDGPVLAGAERYLLELARGLPRDRFAVELAASDESTLDAFETEARGLGLRVHRLPAIPTLARRGAFLKVLRFFAIRRPHVLHFNLADPRSCNGAMAAARLALRRRFVTTEHLPTSVFDDKPLPLRHRLAMRETALTIVLSEAFRSIVETRPGQRGRVAVVPNGVEDPGERSAERRLAARAALGLGEHTGPLVGWVGRLAPQKHPELLVEGIRRVLPERPDVQFVIVGDGPLQEDVQRRVTELGLAERTRFAGQQENARELMQGFDLLVNTSRYEGMPFTILESMAAGVAVICQDIPGMTDLVADQASGLIVAPEDGDRLGEALLAVLANPQKLSSMGRVGRERARTLFSFEAMCSQTAALYDSL